MMSEAKIKQDILIKLGSSKNIRIFNNPVGVGVSGKFKRLNNGSYLIPNGRVVKYGLMPGSADLIGIKKITITEDMVGQSVGVFFSCEVKSKNGSAGEKQKKWASMVDLFGGIAIVCKNVDDISYE